MDALQIINKAMCQMAVQCPPLYPAVKLLKPTEYPEAWRGKNLKEVQSQRISTDGPVCICGSCGQGQCAG